MTADREQVLRWQESGGAFVVAASDYDSLLAELVQAMRERDEAKNNLAVDHEQVRRDAEPVYADPYTRIKWLQEEFDTLKAELEQAEREQTRRNAEALVDVLERLIVGYEERDLIDPESWAIAIRDARKAVAEWKAAQGARGHATEERK